MAWITTPEPPHCPQTLDLAPGFTPVPSHVLQVSKWRIRTCEICFKVFELLNLGALHVVPCGCSEETSWCFEHRENVRVCDAKTLWTKAYFDTRSPDTTPTMMAARERNPRGRLNVQSCLRNTQ